VKDNVLIKEDKKGQMYFDFEDKKKKKGGKNK